MPEVAAVYFAQFQDFDRRQLPDRLLQQVQCYARRQEDPADALLDDRIHRHGLLLRASKQFGSRWSGFLYGGVAYEFEDHRAEGVAGAGITAYLNDSTTLFFSVDYSTSGNAANKGRDVISGSAGLRISF
jgi:hypothetical protein